MLPTAKPRAVCGRPLDAYTFAHLAAGAAFGVGGLSMGKTLIAAVGWEFLERGLKEMTPNTFKPAVQETFSNSFTDVVAVMLGWAGATQLTCERKKP